MSSTEPTEEHKTPAQGGNHEPTHVCKQCGHEWDNAEKWYCGCGGPYRIPNPAIATRQAGKALLSTDRRSLIGKLRNWWGRTVTHPLSRLPWRRTRPACRFVLTNDMRKQPRCINAMLRQQGYTSGDRIVVVLEEDMIRLLDMAHSKVRNPMLAYMLHVMYQEDLTHLRDVRHCAMPTTKPEAKA